VLDLIGALRARDRRLADIAFACGYESVSAFSTAFTRTVGCPPSRHGAGHAPLRN
jgi:AraC-like DNA-binding protein